MMNRMGGPRCAAIHGDKDQRERERVLGDFRSGRVLVLVATDVAARGLGMSGAETKGNPVIHIWCQTYGVTRDNT